MKWHIKAPVLDSKDFAWIYQITSWEMNREGWHLQPESFSHFFHNRDNNVGKSPTHELWMVSPEFPEKSSQDVSLKVLKNRFNKLNHVPYAHGRLPNQNLIEMELGLEAKSLLEKIPPKNYYHEEADSYPDHRVSRLIFPVSVPFTVSITDATDAFRELLEKKREILKEGSLYSIYSDFEKSTATGAKAQIRQYKKWLKEAIACRLRREIKSRGISDWRDVAKNETLDQNGKNPLYDTDDVSSWNKAAREGNKKAVVVAGFMELFY